MKKLFLMFAAIGALASCSKETPIVTVPQENAPVTLDSDPSKGSIRLSFTANVDAFQQIAGGFDADQQAKAIVPTIDTKAANNKFVSLRAEADEAGKTSVASTLIIYEKGTNNVVTLFAPLEVAKDGKSLSFGRNIDAFTVSAPTEKAKLDAMVAKNMQDCYISVMVGNDEGKTSFSNKGVHVIDSWDDDVKLPSNFVLLKNEGTPLELKDGSIVVKDSKAITLKMQGYLMMLRFHNYSTINGIENSSIYQNYPLDLIIGPALSLVQNLKYSFNSTDGKISFSPSPTNEWAYEFNTEKFTTSGREITVEGKKSYEYLTPKDLVIKVKASSEPTASILPKKGDQVIALYFPQPDDYGAISFLKARPKGKIQGPPAHDPYQPTYQKRLLKKHKPSGLESAAKWEKSLENKVYYPVINFMWEEIPHYGGPQ